VDQIEAHRRAQEAFGAVLANVRPEQMGDATPCDEWTVTALIQHVIGGNMWVQQLADVTPPPRTDDILADHAAQATAATAVFAAEGGLTRTFKLPFGDFPGSVFAGIRAGDVLTHAWDLARATGQATDVDPELAVEALAVSQSLILPAFRGPGMPFGAEQSCDDSASPADRLAAFLGRVV
jgi:uncharacterized protein (TIGR03086 family)